METSSPPLAGGTQNEAVAEHCQTQLLTLSLRGCQRKITVIHIKGLTMAGSHHWQLPTWQAEHARKSLLQSMLAQFRWGSAAGCPQAQSTAAGSSPEAACCPASNADGACSAAQG